ncbi:MAG: RIP metalloprotease RseP [Armatimonadaceae bacterium]
MDILAIFGNMAAFALLFGLLVFFHELGHFLAAKSFRMIVEEFAFGFAWPLFKVKVGETQYTVRALPLGGFVRIAGMEVEDNVESRMTGAGDHSAVSEPAHTEEMIPPTPISEDVRHAPGLLPYNHPDRFNNRPAYQRFLVYLAGPVFSFLFGWLALSLVGVVVGYPEKTTMAVREIKQGSVAQEAGVQVGDTFVALNGKPVETMGEALDTIHDSAGKPIVFTLKGKDGQTREVTMTPREETIEGEKVGLIGITPRPVILSSKRQSLPESFADGTKMTGVWFKTITGVFSSFQRVKENVGGPVAIFRETATATEVGGAFPMLLFGQLSLSLGLFNLFPIPILDGGHMLLIGIEVIRGKKLTAEQTNRVLVAGLAVILVLFVTVMFKDISGLFNRG